MRNALKKSGMAVLAAATIAVGSLAAPSTAEARHGGWVGPAIVGGLALGAFAAATAPRYGYAYGPGYGYYGGPVYYSRPAYGPYYGPGPNYQYQRYGGTAPSEFCGQGYYTNCY